MLDVGGAALGQVLGGSAPLLPSRRRCCTWARPAKWWRYPWICVGCTATTARAACWRGTPTVGGLLGAVSPFITTGTWHGQLAASPASWAGCASLGHAHVFNIPFPGRLLLRPSPHQRQIPLCPGSAQRCSAALHLCRALSLLQHLCCGGGRNQWVSYILSTQIPFSP